MSSLNAAAKKRPNRRPVYLLVVLGAALLGLWVVLSNKGSNIPTEAVSASGANAASRPMTATLPMPDHVIVVMEENHSYGQIIGSPSAPYINSLATQGALFTNSHAITHPSQPNYLYLYSGSNQGTVADECPPLQAPFTSGNLGQYVISATLSFIGYSEDLPSVGSQVCRSGQYYRKHNPWVNFSNVPTTSNQPFTSYPIPANYDSLPTVGFVIPNQDHDMHDGTIAQGDTWLQQNLDAYVQWATAHNSLFILTWDEDANNTPTNQIATIFVGPMVVPGQYSEYINHLNVLRTVEDMYNLPHAGQSENYQPITDVWVGGAVTATATPIPPVNTATPTSTLTSIPVPTDTNTSTATPTTPPSQTPSPPPATSTPTLTMAATDTPTILTATATATAEPSGTPALATSTATVCGVSFTDVPAGSTFYPYIRCLACRGIIGGYSNGTFHPNSNVTRGQLSKIVANAAGFNEGHTGQTFEDVPMGSTFYIYVERMFSRSIVGGYPCGGAGEPCVSPDNRPYFRPNNNATRGQISKINSLAAGFSDPPGEQMFEDVPVGSTFYLYVQQLAQRSILGGYPCGSTPQEPCVPPLNMSYFRPNNNATRGQTSKIVANTFFPGCETPFSR